MLYRALKNSGLMYSVSTNEIATLNKIMSKPQIYRKVTNEDLGVVIVNHQTFQFVDDSSNIIGANDIVDIKTYITKFMMNHFYGANRLKLNDEKTCILIMKSKFNKKTFFRTNDGQEVTNSAQIKVLGMYLNGNGNLHTNISKIRSTAKKRLHEI